MKAKIKSFIPVKTNEKQNKQVKTNLLKDKLILPNTWFLKL